jgi:hypothetical protein
MVNCALVPNLLNNISFLTSLVILGISLNRIKKQIIILKQQTINTIMLVHYSAVIPVFITNLIAVLC